MKTLTAVWFISTVASKLAAAQDPPLDPVQEGQGGDGVPPPAPNVDPNRPNENYPYWVTNDYNCVIECLKPFEAPDIPNPAPELESAAYGCAADKCNKEWMGNNMYQMSYIIQMRYATGSIYEDEKMGEWGQGVPPDKNGDGGSGNGGEGDKGKQQGDVNAPQSSESPLSSVNSILPTTMSSSKSVATVTTDKAAPTGHRNETAPGGEKEGDKEDNGAGRGMISGAWLVVSGVMSIVWLL